MNEALKIAFAGSHAAVVSNTFDLMEIAEQEIRRRWRSKREEPAGIFLVLCPHEGFRGFVDTIYRAHARELCTRMAKREKVEPGTAAEVLLALSALSLKAPPSQQYAALYERLFVEVMGRRADGEPVREPWPGASDELLGEMRHKLSRARGPVAEVR